MTKLQRLYRAALNLYPQPFRHQYGEQMEQTLTDMLSDEPSVSGRAKIWLRTGANLPLSLAHQNLMTIGGIMQTETPTYVKRNAVVAMALIAPFFIVLFSRALQHNNASSNGVWQSSLWITLVGLPVIAFGVCLATFAVWSHSRKASLWRGLFDVRRNWMITSVGALALLLALFVPFHDSPHCVAGNPITEISHYHQAWHCIWNS